MRAEHVPCRFERCGPLASLSFFVSYEGRASTNFLRDHLRANCSRRASELPRTASQYHASKSGGTLCREGAPFRKDCSRLDAPPADRGRSFIGSQSNCMSISVAGRRRFSHHPAVVDYRDSTSANERASLDAAMTLLLPFQHHWHL
jgi:hypothetical protein